MTAPDDHDQLRLTVAAVARQIGVAPATLRTWDRRYGLGPSEHRSGSHRRYSAADVARLRHMRALTLEGMAPADAAQLAVAANAQDVGPAASIPASATVLEPAATATAPADVRGVSRAAVALDAAAMTTAFTSAVKERGVVAAWEELMRPVLVAAGQRWETTKQGVDVEHLLSECVTGILHRAAASGAGMRKLSGPSVLLACAPGENHVLPLQALAAALTEQGVTVRLIGAATPLDALTAAVRRTRPAAVVLFAQLPVASPDDLVDAVPALRPAPSIVVGGAGWDLADLPSRAVYVAGLRQAVEVILARLGRAPDAGLPSR